MIERHDRPSSDAEASGRRHRVLLVDDEPSVLRALSRLLRREPYELVSTDNAAEALEMMTAAPADLIITDQRMPEMTGTELLEQIRTRWPNTIRMVLSGYSEVNAILEAGQQGRHLQVPDQAMERRGDQTPHPTRARSA